MTNNFLVFGALVAFGSILAQVPLSEPASLPAASRATTTDSAAPSYAVASRDVLETHHAPVPLVRNVRAPAPTPASFDVPVPGEETQGQDDSDKRAAKAAIEADGYKRVSVLGKAGNGAWRAKAYRGTAEVQLTVDGTGRVSTE